MIALNSRIWRRNFSGSSLPFQLQNGFPRYAAPGAANFSANVSGIPISFF